jgi:DNA (cytosine-5)-methyltransferase 1
MADSVPVIRFQQLSVVSLFAGIGGIELRLHAAGHETVLLCEIDDAATAVLEARFPGIPLAHDVLELDGLPPAGLVAEGFPAKT